ncbi:hypothetical protein N0V90_008127 [Kalmusia sp. IMI 367209]|nr:hypothetical protein N0V90_008127 [Kalmusia sp. IMI 367209]
MSWFARSQRYEKIAPGESSEDVSQQSRILPFAAQIHRNAATHINLLFLVANIIFLAATLWTAQHINSANSLLKRTNTYTPLLHQYDFSFQRVKNNASLFNNPYSIYKDDPSPAVDDAWDAIADTPVLAISKDDVLKMGKDPEYVVGVPEEFGKARIPDHCIDDKLTMRSEGYGPNKYFAVNDGQHLIHCLNEVRKFAYYDYYYLPAYGNASNLPRLVAAHRSHCVGVLLDALTCQPSLNMVVWEWMEGMREPWPDFNVWRKCQDYGLFYEWQKGAQVEIEKIKGWDWGEEGEKRGRCWRS